MTAPLLNASTLQPTAATGAATGLFGPGAAAEGPMAGFEALQWYGIVAPPGTPTAIVTKLNEVCNRTLSEAPFRARLETEGATAQPMTPAQFGEYIARERERWGALIRRNNVSLG